MDSLLRNAKLVGTTIDLEGDRPASLSWTSGGRSPISTEGGGRGFGTVPLGWLVLIDSMQLGLSAAAGVLVLRMIGN
jgi:hypothetical protein